MQRHVPYDVRARNRAQLKEELDFEYGNKGGKLPTSVGTSNACSISRAPVISKEALGRDRLPGNSTAHIIPNEG